MRFCTLGGGGSRGTAHTPLGRNDGMLHGAARGAAPCVPGLLWGVFMSLQIAAPPWRGTIFFQHHNGQGHSESFWMSAANPDTALTDLIAISTARQAMFAPSCRVKFWRLSDSTIKGDTYVKQAQATTLGTYGSPDPPFDDMMPPEVGLKTRFQHVEAYYAYRIIKFLPEDCVTDGFWTPTPAMDTAWNSLRTALLAKTTGVFKQIHLKPVPPEPAVKALSEIVPLSISTHKVGAPFGLREGRSALR